VVLHRFTIPIIINKTVDNRYLANACTTVMNDGKGVVQPPIDKQKLITGIDVPRTNESITRTGNILIILHKTT
jgi:hypothetical protein